MANLDNWFVCPVKPTNGRTTESFLDRTPGFLVRSNLEEIALPLAKKAEPTYAFTGETIPYKRYVPGLSEAGQLQDLQRWIGFMNHPDEIPLGTVVQMD